MKTYTQQELEALIACPKLITEPPRKEMKSDRGSLRNDMYLESVDGKMGFSVFIRINERFNENFSIGLDAHPKDEPGSFCLLRCNGPHGEHVDNPHPHFRFHIHKAKQENIEAGLLPERFAEPTKNYGSYEEALLHFVKLTNIENAEQYLDVKRQLPLFKIIGDES